MVADQKIVATFAAAIPFVEARRKKTGGFAATPRLPATIEDTYHALHILALARQSGTQPPEDGPSGDGKIRDYLASCQSLPAGAKIVFQWLWSCSAVGLELGPSTMAAIEANVVARLRSTDTLEEWYYLVKILAEVLHREPAALVERDVLAAVMERKWLGVDEAWMRLYLSRVLQGDFAVPAESIAWFQACQNGDGGFGFFPGTTSFVENCHYCLQALSFLGGQPRDPIAARSFLAGCQTASGGFGRSSQAASFLDATWHAMAGISLIETAQGKTN